MERLIRNWENQIQYDDKDESGDDHSGIGQFQAKVPMFGYSKMALSME